MNLTRRNLIASVPIGAVLAACGGGAANDVTTPEILEFAVDAPPRVGERARLRVRFRGGNGRVEPSLGAVSSGSTIETAVISASQRFKLIVSAPGQPDVTQELNVEAGWRYRLRNFDTSPMAGHATVATSDGAALVIGGSRSEGTLSTAIERFDPNTLRLVRLGDMAAGRSEMSAIAIGDSRVLVFGGSDSTAQPPFAEIIDSRSGVATFGGWLRLSRNRHAALRLSEDRVLVVGGIQRNSAELWNPATSTWTLVGNRMAHTREHATASLLPNGSVLIVGGYTPAATYVFAEVFNPATATFTAVPGAPDERRWLHGALLQADGSVLIVGGENDNGAVSSVWKFDFTTQRFIAQTPLSSPRSVVRAVITPDDEVLMYGGEQLPDEGLTSGEALKANVHRELPPMSTPRAWHTMTRLTNGQILLLGGQHQSDLIAGGTLYD